MKKLTRGIALLTTVLLLCGALTGCQALDDARAAHGTWAEDGNILWNGTVYRPLPECEQLSPLFMDEYENTVYVTSSDVPVLLSAFGDAFSISRDGVLLGNQDRFYNEVISFYCRADRYDSLLQQIQEGPQMTGFCYEYYAYDEAEGYVNVQYVLTPEQADTVNEILDTAIPHGAYSLDWDYMVTLTACSEDQYFRGDSYDLLFLGTKYYLVLSSEDPIAQPQVCDVPMEYYPMFADIMKEGIDAQKQVYEDEDYESDGYIAF